LFGKILNLASVLFIRKIQTNMKIAFFSTKSYDIEYFERFNATFQHEFQFFETRLNEKTVNLINNQDAVCVFVNDDLNKKTIAELHKKGVKLIALRCTGFNNVDLKVAKVHGIKVVRVPAYSPYAVAEHAVALILTLNRKTHKAYNRVRDSNFSLEKLVGFDLHGKTVGVIGTGKIGAIFCQIMQGFGCHVLAFDPYPNAELIEKGVEYQALDDLLLASDIISLHCPLTPETHHIIDAEALEKIKKGAMLINTSRGALVDTTAVISALKYRQLGHLAIDVYEQEEALFFQDLSGEILDDEEISRLLTFPNVLITAHQSFFTSEALEQIATTTLQNISDFEAAKPLVNALNI
jgi:D-lactate dehydrogenase